MTRSIFDPQSGETERSGNQNMGPAADNDSHMPPGIVDAKVSPEEILEQDPTRAGEESPERNDEMEKQKA